MNPGMFQSLQRYVDLAGLVCLLVAALSGNAEAQVATPTDPDYGALPERPPPVRADQAARTGTRYWYGWQNLSIDVAAVASAVLVIDSDEGEPQWLLLGAGLYLFGGPTVHFLHERQAEGWWSFGLRAAAPVLTALTLVGLTEITHNNCGGEDGCGLIRAFAVVVGGGIGILSASLVDASVLSYGRSPRKRSEDVGMRVMLRRDGAELHVGGSF